jgi:hypothetical protein
MCHNLGIKCSTNSIIERIHQVMGNMLRSFELEDRELHPDDPWNDFLQACDFATRRKETTSYFRC